MENLFVRLQNQEINTVVVPEEITAAEVYAISLMRTAFFGLTNVIKTNVPDKFLNDNSCIVLDMGGGEYDSINNPRIRDDGTQMSTFGIIWNEMKEYYADELQDTFEQEFVIPTEQGNLMSKYVEKLLAAKTGIELTYALNASYRILKVWTIKK